VFYGFLRHYLLKPENSSENLIEVFVKSRTFPTKHSEINFLFPDQIFVIASHSLELAMNFYYCSRVWYFFVRVCVGELRDWSKLGH